MAAQLCVSLANFLFLFLPPSLVNGWWPDDVLLRSNRVGENWYDFCLFLSSRCRRVENAAVRSARLADTILTAACLAAQPLGCTTAAVKTLLSGQLLKNNVWQ